MSPILSTLLFAAAATAHVTTSMWMPSPYQGDTHIGFYASVVGVSDGATTLALDFDDKTDLATAGYIVEDAANTMTFYGSSSFESIVTTKESPNAPALTMGYGCKETSARGGASVGAVCHFMSDGVAAHTYDIAQNEVATYQVVITAGTEKLKPTAAAKPSSSIAVPTGSATLTLHRGQNVAPAETAIAAPAVHVEETKGAAGALLPPHSALAGLTAFAAAAMALLL